MDIKVQVLHAPEIEERERADKTKYYSRALQCFVMDGVCVHTLYADKKEDLEQFNAGFYMTNLIQRAGDRARMGFTVGELRPVQQGKAA